MEEWKNIDGLNGEYQISNKGNIKHNNKILKSHKDSDGYLIITLFINKKHTTFKIHRLVASAFIPNENNYKQVNHIDCNKINNNVENLEWCSLQQNIKHAKDNNLFSKRSLSKRYKKINQYDKDGNYIKTWNSIKEAGDTLGICRSTITRVCKQKPGVKTYKGYIWRYT